jgi:hypothetical protein
MLPVFIVALALLAAGCDNGTTSDGGGYNVEPTAGNGIVQVTFNGQGGNPKLTIENVLINTPFGRSMPEPRYAKHLFKGWSTYAEDDKNPRAPADLNGVTGYTNTAPWTKGALFDESVVVEGYLTLNAKWIQNLFAGVWQADETTIVNDDGVVLRTLPRSKLTVDDYVNNRNVDGETVHGGSWNLSDGGNGNYETIDGWNATGFPSKVYELADGAQAQVPGPTTFTIQKDAARGYYIALENTYEVGDEENPYIYSAVRYYYRRPIVTFNLNGGTVHGSTDTIQIDVTETRKVASFPDAPAYTQEVDGVMQHYLFAGWFTERATKAASPGDFPAREEAGNDNIDLTTDLVGQKVWERFEPSTDVLGDITVFARWSTTLTFKITPANAIAGAAWGGGSTIERTRLVYVNEPVGATLKLLEKYFVNVIEPSRNWNLSESSDGPRVTVFTVITKAMTIYPTVGSVGSAQVVVFNFLGSASMNYADYNGEEDVLDYNNHNKDARLLEGSDIASVAFAVPGPDTPLKDYTDQLGEIYGASRVQGYWQPYTINQSQKYVKLPYVYGVNSGVKVTPDTTHIVAVWLDSSVRQSVKVTVWAGPNLLGGTTPPVNPSAMLWDDGTTYGVQSVTLSVPKDTKWSELKNQTVPWPDLAPIAGNADPKYAPGSTTEQQAMVQRNDLGVIPAVPGADALAASEAGQVLNDDYKFTVDSTITFQWQPRDTVQIIVYAASASWNFSGAPNNRGDAAPSATLWQGDNFNSSNAASATFIVRKGTTLNQLTDTTDAGYNPVYNGAFPTFSPYSEKSTNPSFNGKPQMAYAEISDNQTYKLGGRVLDWASTKFMSATTCIWYDWVDTSDMVTVKVYAASASLNLSAAPGDPSATLQPATIDSMPNEGYAYATYWVRKNATWNDVTTSAVGTMGRIPTFTPVSVTHRVAKSDSGQDVIRFARTSTQETAKLPGSTILPTTRFTEDTAIWYDWVKNDVVKVTVHAAKPTQSPSDAYYPSATLIRGADLPSATFFVRKGVTFANIKDTALQASAGYWPTYNPYSPIAKKSVINNNVTVLKFGPTGTGQFNTSDGQQLEESTKFEEDTDIWYVWDIVKVGVQFYTPYQLSPQEQIGGFEVLGYEETLAKGAERTGFYASTTMARYGSTGAPWDEMRFEGWWTSATHNGIDMGHVRVDPDATLVNPGFAGTVSATPGVASSDVLYLYADYSVPLTFYIGNWITDGRTVIASGHVGDGNGYTHIPAILASAATIWVRYGEDLGTVVATTFEAGVKPVFTNDLMKAAFNDEVLDQLDDGDYGAYTTMSQPFWADVGDPGTLLTPTTKITAASAFYFSATFDLEHYSQ